MRKLFFLLLFASLAAAVSSNEALEALGPCLRESNPQLQPMTTTFMMDGTPFWAFSYPLASTRKMVAGVTQEEGQVLQDSDRLKRLAEGMYNDLVIRDYIRAKGYSADTLETAVDGSLVIIDDQYAKLQIFQTKTAEKYPNLSFQILQSKLDVLRSRADVLKLQLQNTVSEEQFHQSSPSAESANAVILQYNNSFTLMFDFFDAYREYSEAITNVQRQLYEQSIPDPDNKNINTNLENLRDVGISSLYTKAKAADPRKNLVALTAQGQQWVEDSVSSFKFQDLSCRANAAYDAALPQYKLVVGNENRINSAGFSREVGRIKGYWKLVEDARAKRNAEGYQYLLDELPKVTADIKDLTGRYQGQISATATPAPAEKAPDYSTWVIFLLLLALGGYGFWMYRKKAQEQEESGELH